MPLPDVVRPLLDRFTADVGGVLPLTALWAHGSLALGDYQPGRSDLDLVALTGTAPASEQQQDLRRVHEALHSQHRSRKSCTARTSSGPSWTTRTAAT